MEQYLGEADAAAAAARALVDAGGGDADDGTAAYDDENDLQFGPRSHYGQLMKIETPAELLAGLQADPSMAAHGDVAPTLRMLEDRLIALDEGAEKTQWAALLARIKATDWLKPDPGARADTRGYALGARG